MFLFQYYVWLSFIISYLDYGCGKRPTYMANTIYKRSNIQSNKKTHYNKKYLYYLVKPGVFFFVFIIIIKKYSYHVF